MATNAAPSLTDIALGAWQEYLAAEEQRQEQQRGQLRARARHDFTDQLQRNLHLAVTPDDLEWQTGEGDYNRRGVIAYVQPDQTLMVSAVYAWEQGHSAPTRLGPVTVRAYCAAGHKRPGDWLLPDYHRDDGPCPIASLGKWLVSLPPCQKCP